MHGMALGDPLAQTFIGYRDLLEPRSSELPHEVLVGASGGISALVAFYALAFPRARMRLFFLSLRFGIVRWLSFSVRTWLVLWLGMQLIGALNQAQGLTLVSSAVHLGGATAGLIAWHYWRS